MKKTIRETLRRDIKWELDTDLDTAIQRLIEYRDEYKDTHTNVSLDIESISDYYSSHHASIELYGYRLETDIEERKRVNEEVRRNELSESQELALLKKLAKKHAKDLSEEEKKKLLSF